MRIDVWLWAVRLTTSRSIAADLCRSGRVRINDKVAKPSASVAVGDRVTWRDPLRDRVIEVVELLPKRVGAPIAAKAYLDHSPALPTRVEREAVGLPTAAPGVPPSASGARSTSFAGGAEGRKSRLRGPVGPCRWSTPDLDGEIEGAGKYPAWKGRTP